MTGNTDHVAGTQSGRVIPREVIATAGPVKMRVRVDEIAGSHESVRERPVKGVANCTDVSG